jgi:hypothetical protein
MRPCKRFTSTAVTLAAALTVLAGCGGGDSSGPSTPVEPPVATPNPTSSPAPTISPAPTASPTPIATPTATPTVPAQQPPNLKVACDAPAAGQGRDFQVGSDAGQLANINDVPWESLEPGDTVRIFWRATPYREKIMIGRSGTAAKPIRVCGVLGGPNADQRPFITGDEAATRPQLAQLFNANADPDDDIQPFGVMQIWAPNWGSQVQHVVVENLRLGDSMKGEGRESDAAFFFDMKGKRKRYNAAAGCIRLKQAQNIMIRANELTNCGDGIFAGSAPDSQRHLIRDLLVEGNYLHNSGIAGTDQRHQVYLQGMGITVQFNYFGATRKNAGGNQVKTRAAGLVIRYNYIENGARSLDIVEAEEHSPLLHPWTYAYWRARYLGCQQQGCLKLNAAEIAKYDQLQQQDWANYQVAYVYGNLLRIAGRDGNGNTVPTNVVHYGFDNSQHDRQPGTLWFYHNTVLYETDRNNLSTVRLFDYGSDFGDGGYYGYAMNHTNVNGTLHYLTNAAGKTCQQLTADCTDWGAMLQTANQADFGRMRAWNNAIVLKSFSAAQSRSYFEWTRNLWDQLDIEGANWITSGWDASNEFEGAFGRRRLPAANVYPGGNDAHHVTGLNNLLTGAAVPIDTATFAPLTGSPLLSKAAALPEALQGAAPVYQIRVDAAQPGRVFMSPRNSNKTLGAIE